VRLLEEALNVSVLEGKLLGFDEVASKPDFWDDPDEAQKILGKANMVRSKINGFRGLEKKYYELLDLLEICAMEEDESFLSEIKMQIKNVCEELDMQTVCAFLTGEYDTGNAILTLHAGAGGTEAQDWAEMLYRMYCRWSERHGYKVKLLDSLDGEGAGLKSVSILVQGENAYGYLKGEAGVHRLVRISPFDSSGRRHTSFASIEVIPEIDDKDDIEISLDDIKMDVFRASGAGGQHVNKTSSAVRLTHLPTGIVVACQNERSQYQNRDMAMKMLKSKLVEIKHREHLEKIEDIKGVQKEITWGSQIRSYVFMPYTLVKDHRTGHEVGNVGAVMDGDIDEFVTAYLKSELRKS
jgi:peptide chain release factor 2